MKNRLYIWMVAATVLLMTVDHKTPESLVGVSAIQVYAGEDTNLCPGSSIELSQLDAYITGEVSNGFWFTSGDGRFVPGFTTSSRFSVATMYMPGVLDNANGGFTLTLVSDDPDLDPITGTNGPKVQVSDQVRISFPPPPTLVCNTNLQVSLNFDCTIELEADVLVANPRMPYDDYTVTMFDKNNQIIPNNLLTKEHLKQNITFRVGHACTSHFCQGNLQVYDYYPPIFVCKNDTISCLEDAAPLQLGLPVPTGATVDSIRNGKIYVRNWDACGQVQLTYTESIQKRDCSIPVFDKIITRQWSAKDESQNLSTCFQTIFIRKTSLTEITFPPSFDDVQAPSFDCLDTFPVFPNGHPSTDTTGIPTGGMCDNIGIIMTDLRFETCGAGFKIARSWFVIEWCSQESVTRNQIILVKDKLAPSFVCPEDFTVGTGFYQCATGQETLPLPEFVTDCSDYQTLVTISNTSGQNFNANLFFSNQNYYINNLPLGNYIVTYILIDACQNTAQCSLQMRVLDVAPPIPVCDKDTKISVDPFGNARLFATSLDDGSWDNCGIQKFEVRRKNSSCGQSLDWRPFADFCCADVGTLQHISLQVTDIHGLVNTCHVEIEVEDKIKPVITCPSHITISCDNAYDPQNPDLYGKVVTIPADRKPIIIFDRINQGIVGQDGLATDNCTINITKREKINVQCFKGTIERTFIATDKGNLKDSCTQIITLRNPDPFDYVDITWPQHYTGQGCKISDVDTSVSGAPKYKNTSCSTIASYYEDQPFYLADSACVKIFRNWYVIDWCQFDQTTQNGKWGPFTQIIKIHNTTPPTLLSGCRDTLICFYGDNCGAEAVFLQAAATDDCTPADALTYQYQFDSDNDGTINFTGPSRNFDRPIPLGNHSITWTVWDNCGNVTSCKQLITTRDCKKPTPYCRSQVSMTLDETTHQAEIWASDMNLGSFDNCTQQQNLVFSFSADTADQVAFLSCDDLNDGIAGEVLVDMFVTDHNGNQDFCSVSIYLTDNHDVCQDDITFGDISGKVSTTTGFTPDGIHVRFNIEGKTEFATAHPNAQGIFSIPQVTTEFEYVLKPQLLTEVERGISGLDLILTQRHILGLKEFSSPYQWIAADVNRSRSINSLDLVEIRKIILGTRTQFPNNVPSWVFVDETYEFPFGPLGEKFKDTIVTRSPSTQQNFVAVKMGDVDNSFQNGFRNYDPESRNQKHHFEILHNKTEDGPTWTLRNSAEKSLDGFQIFMKVPKKYQPELWTISSSFQKNGVHFFHHITPSDKDSVIIKLLCYTDKSIQLSEEEVMVQINVPDNASMIFPANDIHWLSTEYYADESTFPLSVLSVTDIVNNIEKSGFSLTANPVSDVISIQYALEHEMNISYVLSDISGKIILEQKDQFIPSGQGFFDINLNHDMVSGMYVLHVFSDTRKETFSVIKIE
ncbi:MAG: T9SS type A sorting domain-containing protein [Saprospiraceae bacterium]|nr:T9SS type A sorting domain-containing protein [Saprospiraceae bacterium]